MDDLWKGSRKYTQDGDVNQDNIFTKDVYRCVDSTQISLGLKYFPAAMNATILEDALMQMRILGECNNELRIIKTMSDMELLRAAKYKVAQPLLKDELDGINARSLGCLRYKLDKLAADRKYIIDGLVATYLDMSLQRSFSALAERINKIEERDAQRAFLIEDEAKNKTAQRDLMRQLRQQRNHNKSAMYDTDLVIDQLKSSVEDANLNAEAQSRYVSNWQLARTEQHARCIGDIESGPSEVIKYFRQRTDHEQRVHSEVETLSNILINEALSKVEFWMDKYDKDMEQLDLKIQIMKNDYQIRHDQRVDMEDTLGKHEIKMNEWNHFKDERTKARLYHEKMTNAAIAVQAWWRGLLVRLELGPYKPTKKRGAPAGGKKKK